MRIKISEELDAFINEVDALCFKHGYEIWPNEKRGERDSNGDLPTITIHGPEERVNLIYIDGDGRGR